MIDLQHVCVYYGNKIILNDLSAVFSDGEFACILGKNGSGKSTLLKALDGFLPCHGQILLDNINIRELSGKDRAKKIAYLPQIRQIPNIEVRALIACGRFPYHGFSTTLTAQDRDQVMYAAELTSVQNMMHRNIAELSGGERQRVYLAMLIAQDTKTILLDEPTTYMDINHQLEFLNILSGLNKKGKNIIMAVHDLPQAFTFGSKIYIIHNGVIIETGAPADLFMKPILKNIFDVALEKKQSISELYEYHLIKQN